MQKSILTLAIVATASLSVMAQTETLDNSINNADLTSIFDLSSETPLVLAELSTQEMRDTQGAFFPVWASGALLGAGSGAFGYGLGVWQKHYDWDTQMFIGNVTTGAITGAGFGIIGAAAGGGYTVGANLWRFNNFSLNFGVNSYWRR